MKIYPNNLFHFLGVSEDVGLKAIGKLSVYDRNILYKRWGDDLVSGDEAIQNQKLSKYETKILKERILPRLKCYISIIKGPNSNPVIIEHSGYEYFTYIREKFKGYDERDILQLIFDLMKSLGFNYKDGYKGILNFVKSNNDLILNKIKENGLIYDKNLELVNTQLTMDERLWQILRSIKDKYFATYLLEDVIKATKISMLRCGIKNYDNFFIFLDFLINNPFSVFRILKTDLIGKSKTLITTVLNYTNELGESFVDIDYILSNYYLGIDNGYSVEEVLQILSSKFNISSQLILEFVANQNLNSKKITR